MARRHDGGANPVTTGLSGRWARGTIEEALVDTCHDRCSVPDRCSMRATGPTAFSDGPTGLVTHAMAWRALVPETEPGPDAEHRFEPTGLGPATPVRLHVRPDGGLSRLRLWDRPTRMSGPGAPSAGP